MMLGKSKQNRLFAKLVLLGIGFAMVVFAAPALAIETGLEYGTATGLGTQDLRVSIMEVIRVALGALGIIAILITLYGGFTWMTAAGNEEKITRAKTILRNGAVGLVIIFLSFAIVSFVIGALIDATGAGDPPGEPEPPIITVYTPTCRVISIVPNDTPEDAAAGKRRPMNTVVRVRLSNAPVAGAETVRIIDQTSGQPVAGTYTTQGGLIAFTPDANCPAPHADRKCLPANTTFAVQLDTTTLSCGGAAVTCGVDGSACAGQFTTGDFVDIAGPNVILADQQICQGFNTLQAIVNDDYGLGEVQFSIPATSAVIGVDSQVRVPPATIASVGWNTSDSTAYPLGSTVGVRAAAVDLDSNTTIDNRDYLIRPAHCCNAIKDEDETAVDCGGNGCEACTPVISWVMPIDGAPGNLVTIHGRHFGDYVPGTSQVTFADANGQPTVAADLASVANPACTDSWTPTEIIATIPATGADGPLAIAAVNNGVTATDRTDDTRGARFAFDINTTVRPGLCQVSPGTGRADQSTDLYGIGFINNSRVFFAAAPAGGAPVVQNAQTITDARVPALEMGSVAVRSQDPTSAEYSNPKTFSVDQLPGTAFTACDADTAAPSCQVDSTKCAEGFACDPTSCLCQPSTGPVGVGVACDTDTDAPACQPGSTICTGLNPDLYCATDSCTCQIAQMSRPLAITYAYSFQSGIEPGKCSTDAGVCSPDSAKCSGVNEVCSPTTCDCVVVPPPSCTPNDQALVFNGTDRSVVVRNPAPFYLQSLTLEAWVRVDQFTGIGLAPVYTIESSGQGLISRLTLLGTSGSITSWNATFNTTQGNKNYTGPISGFSLGEWHHVSLALAAGQVPLVYVDGVFAPAAQTAPLPPLVYTTAQRFVLGEYVASRLRGALDDVAIFNRVLSATEIQNRAAHRPAGQESQLAFWRFNQLNGGIAVDDVGKTTDEPNGLHPADVIGAAPFQELGHNPCPISIDPGAIACDRNADAKICDPDPTICQQYNAAYACDPVSCTCKPAELNLPLQSTYTWSFTTTAFGPQVVEECNRTASCDNFSFTSPFPFDRAGTAAAGFLVSPIRTNDGPVPVDAIVGAMFTTKMQVGSLTTNTVKVFACGSHDAALVVGDCTEVIAGQVEVTACNYRDTQTSDADCLAFVPNNPLPPNRWFLVQLQADQIFGENGVALAGNVVGNNFYKWIFSTRNSTQPSVVSCVSVRPAASTLHMYDERQAYAAYPRSADFTCVDIGPDSCSAYNWGVQNPPDRARVVPDAEHPLTQRCNGTGRLCGTSDPAHPSCPTDQTCQTAVDDLASNDHRATVAAHSDSTADIPPYTTVSVQCVIPNAQPVTGTSQLTIDFSRPVVIDKFPDCGTACLNAKIGATFSRPMETSTVTQGGIKLYICYDDSSCDLSAEGIARPVAGFTMLAGADPAEAFNTYTGSVGCFDRNGDGRFDYCLLPNTHYRVVIDGAVRAADAGGQPGKTLGGLNYDDPLNGVAADGSLDAYSWVFKTQAEMGLCLPSEISVLPTIKFEPEFNVTVPYASAGNKIDQCEPDFGQRLDPNSFAWQWASTQPTVADLVTDNGTLRDACGNGVVQPGEDCDDGNTASGDGCSGTDAAAACTHEGVDAVTCANGRVDVGEECQPGTPNCGPNCLRTGNTNYSVGTPAAALEVCGNGILEAHEACEPRNTPECNAQCQFTGSIGALSCGNGQIDWGEECDDADLVIGQSPAGGDGCSATCLIENRAATSFCQSATTNRMDFRAACTGSSECDAGSSCISLNTITGNSNAGQPVCGNFIVEGGEECDYGGRCSDNYAPCTVQNRSACANSATAVCRPAPIQYVCRTNGRPCDPTNFFGVCGASASANDCVPNAQLGCTDQCINAGSVQERIDPPNVGPYQLAMTRADGETFIQANVDRVGPPPLGQGRLVVGAGADNGGFRIKDRWPKCAEACLNAAMGGQFTQSADLETLTEDNIFLYECAPGDSQCATLTDVGVDIVANHIDPKNDNDTFRMYLPDDYNRIDTDNDPMTAEVSTLRPNTYYRIVVRGSVVSAVGPTGLRQRLGSLNYDDPSFVPNAATWPEYVDKAPDAYSWIFKTKNDPTLCAPSRVEVIPTRNTLSDGDVRYRYAAQPWSAADSCSGDGQRLNPYAYSWAWNAVGTTPNPSGGLYNGANLLVSMNAAGAITPWVDTTTAPPANATVYPHLFDGCGNGVVERGEDCDPGLQSVPGCNAASCLWAEPAEDPSTALCGNRKVDVGESCDDGGWCVDENGQLLRSPATNRPVHCTTTTVATCRSIDPTPDSEPRCQPFAGVCTSGSEPCNTLGSSCTPAQGVCLASGLCSLGGTSCTGVGSPCPATPGAGVCLRDGCSGSCQNNGSTAQDNRIDPYQIAQTISAGVLPPLMSVEEEIRAWPISSPALIGVGNLTVSAASQVSLQVIGHQPAPDATNQCRNVALWATFSREVDAESLGGRCTQSFACANAPLVDCTAFQRGVGANPCPQDACSGFDGNPDGCTGSSFCQYNAGRCEVSSSVCQPQSCLHGNDCTASGDECKFTNIAVCAGGSCGTTAPTQSVDPDRNLIRGVSQRVIEGTCIETACHFPTTVIDPTNGAVGACQTSADCRGTVVEVTALKDGFLAPNTPYEWFVRSGENGVRASSGTELIRNLSCSGPDRLCQWSFTTSADFCTCDYIGVEIANSSGGQETSQDAFTCATDMCGQRTESPLDDDTRPEKICNGGSRSGAMCSTNEQCVDAPCALAGACVGGTDAGDACVLTGADAALDCGGNGECQALPGNQHVYIAQCYDVKNPQQERIPLASRNMSFAWSTPPASAALVSLNDYQLDPITNDGEGNRRQFVTPEPTNGKSYVTVQSYEYICSVSKQPCVPEIGCTAGAGTCSQVPFTNRTIAITNFICENPWPDLARFPYEDSKDNNQGRDTNFQLYYCRDAGGPGTADDLPALTLNPAVFASRGSQTVKDLLFSVEGESGSDAIGVQVRKNPLHLSPSTWYQSGLCGGVAQIDNVCFADADCAGIPSIGHWTFDEDGGTVAEDSSGSGATGTFSAGVAPVWEPLGRFGSALRFGNAAGRQNVELSNANQRLTVTRPVSLSAWVYLDPFTAGTTPEEQYLIDGPQYRLSVFHQASSNTFYAQVRIEAGSGTVVTSAIPLFAGRWHHVVGTFDGQVVRLAVDGIFDRNVANLSAPISAAGGNVMIGGSRAGNGANQLHAVLDEVQLFALGLDGTTLETLFGASGLGSCQFNVPLRGSPESIVLDGYEAVRDGRTVYVGAANLEEPTLYSHMYLLSYSQSAGNQTIEIFNRMLDQSRQKGGWIFTTNVNDSRTCQSAGLLQGTQIVCGSAVGSTIGLGQSAACSYPDESSCNNTKEAIESGCSWNADRKTCVGRVCEPISCNSNLECPSLGSYCDIDDNQAFTTGDVLYAPNDAASCVRNPGVCGGHACLPRFVSCQAEKQELVRDTARLGDLRDLQLTLRGVYNRTKTYPLLGGGSYVPSTTLSVWPSWQQTFGQALGGAIATDPINRLVGCTGDEDAQSTCWDDQALEFSCPADGYVYGYRAAAGGTDYELYANLEYDGIGSWRTRPSRGYCDANRNGRVDVDEMTTACVSNQACGSGVSCLGPYQLPTSNVISYCDNNSNGTVDSNESVASNHCGAGAACATPGKACIPVACGFLDFEVDATTLIPGISPAECTPDDDTTGNGIGDDDQDGVCDNRDNCVGAYNSNQADANNDGLGDACDVTCTSDADRDGICDGYDSCQVVSNCFAPLGDGQYCGDCTGGVGAGCSANGQLDRDRDGIGDSCDPCTDVDLDGSWDIDTGTNTCPRDSAPAASLQSLGNGLTRGEPMGWCQDANESRNGQRCAAGIGCGAGFTCFMPFGGLGISRDHFGFCTKPNPTNPANKIPDVSRSCRLTGEDTNFNGVIDVINGVSEDGNGNGTLDGPMYSSVVQSKIACSDVTCGGEDFGTFNPLQEDYDNDGIGYIVDDCIDFDKDGFGDYPFFTRVFNPDLVSEPAGMLPSQREHFFGCATPRNAEQNWVQGTGAVCGNGIQEGAEACDDNNTVSGDGCSSYCLSETGAGTGNTQIHLNFIFATNNAGWIDQFCRTDLRNLQSALNLSFAQPRPSYTLWSVPSVTLPESCASIGSMRTVVGELRHLGIGNNWATALGAAPTAIPTTAGGRYVTIVVSDVSPNAQACPWNQVLNGSNTCEAVADSSTTPPNDTTLVVSSLGQINPNIMKTVLLMYGQWYYGGAGVPVSDIGRQKVEEQFGRLACTAGADVASMLTACNGKSDGASCGTGGVCAPRGRAVPHQAGNGPLINAILDLVN